jgi:Fe2+ or Zn2+ uptake regulation protein
MSTPTHQISDQWLASLQESGYRITGPRRSIVEIMATNQRALSPIEIFDLGRRDYPGLGLVTVYRTLEKMEELGLVQRVHQEGGCHMYLRAASGHEHLLVCTSCGQMRYFEGDELSPLIESVSKSTGFRVVDHWLQLSGLCPTCRK